MKNQNQKHIPPSPPSKGGAALAIAFLLGMGMGQNAHADLKDGLVAHYCFDDSTNIGKDCSTNGNNGELIGQVNSVTGLSGNAANFGGYNNPASIHVPNSPSLQFTNDATISFAVNMTGLDGMTGYGSYGNYGAHAAFAKSHDRRGFIINLSGNDAKQLSSGAGSFEWGNNGIGGTTDNYQVGQWRYFTYVFSNSTHIAKLYADGVLIKTLDTFNQSFESANAQDLYLGKFSDKWYPLNGSLDEVRIYNRALTEAEVLELYNGGGVVSTKPVLVADTGTTGVCSSTKTAAMQVGRSETVSSSSAAEVCSTNTAPIITSVTPNESVIGKPTVFEVHGKNLNPYMGFTVGDCAYSNVALTGGTSELQKFVCTQFGATGKKHGLLKTSASGTTLKEFDVTAVSQIDKTATATISGKISFSSSLPAKNVVLFGDEVNACLTDGNGKFSCKVPKNWTGVLVPQAKGVQFSPARISLKSANNKAVAVSATTTDTFPLNAAIPNDWKGTWKIDVGSGEVNDKTAAEGRLSLRSPKIGANQIATIETTVSFNQAVGYVEFARRVSSSENNGVLKFYIDDTLQQEWSGEVDWGTERFSIITAANVFDTSKFFAPNTHKLRWEYTKNSASAGREDAAWIDNVIFPSTIQTSATDKSGNITCDGVTKATFNLMTATKPSCEQLQSYLIWLKIIRPTRFNESENFKATINGIETSNETAQNWISTGAKIVDYSKSLYSVGKVVSEASSKVVYVKQLQFVNGVQKEVGKLGSQVDADVFSLSCNTIENEVDKEACSIVMSAFITTGVELALEGTKNLSNPWVFVTEKLSSAAVNLFNAGRLKGVEEQVNSFNLADDFLDEYYKGGANVTALETMRKKYGAKSIDYTDLINSLATKKGYTNGDYDIPDILKSINAVESFIKQKVFVFQQSLLKKSLQNTQPLLP